MTADERIEILLNRFGQTISDLPTANDYKRQHSQIPHLIAAMDAAEAWYDPESNEKIAYSMMAYICHLVEIIDRMEWALSNAELHNIHFDIVKCVTGGDGFEEGGLYCVVGWNNGVHVLRENEEGDCYEFLACHGGYGKGIINDFEGSGAPSFEYIKMQRPFD